MNKSILVIASGNPKKVAEISGMLNVLNLIVQKQPESLNVEETGDSYLENAFLKAKAAATKTNSWALADDSGLEVDYLDGRPGIYSARYAKSKEEKLNKLIREMGNTPYRTARFISCMVLCDPNGKLVKDCLLYTSDAADEYDRVDLGGRRIIKKIFFSSRRRHTRLGRVSWARRCV